MTKSLELTSQFSITLIANGKKTIYNLKADKRVYKIGEGEKLEKIDVSHLPNYIKNNELKYKKWIQE